MTLTLQTNPMATTQLVRAEAQRCWLLHEPKMGFRPLRMNWVVVTDANGNRRLQLSWLVGGAQ